MRLYVGKDPTSGKIVSIHAPAWGATTNAIDMRAVVAVSIHAPAWGATSAAPTYELSLYVSIHAPAWGATASSHQ